MPKETRTLIFKNQYGSLTITGSDAFGLPTVLDADAMIALLHLTKIKSDFKESVVYFTRYELLRLLGWPNEGKSYRRLSESLNRWHGVSLIYDGCWWDNRAKRHGDAKIHILESVVILEGSGKTVDDGAQQSLPLSSFEWNKKFIESCQADNLKHLDLSLYFSLKHPTSKQLYRYLDKRFYRQSNIVFDLMDIGFERVGLSRNYDIGKLKEKLQPAIDELEEKGFLEPLSREERYFKEGRAWKVRFVHKPPVLAVPPVVQPTADPEPPSLVAELARRGVHKETAVDLVRRHPGEKIEQKLGVFDWLTERRDKRIARSPAGYLVKSIENDYATPKGFASRADRQREEEARQAGERQAAEVCRRKREEKTREKDDQKAIIAFWDALSSQEQAELQARADDALADPADLANETGTLKRIGQRIRRNEYIRRLLKNREPVAEQA